ncbi:hypothetical protein ACIBF1_18975 [Spirillospora sp. NPDC050679]
MPESFSLKGEEPVETTALMFGRRSYDAFAPFWPGSADHAAYKDLPEYVVSTTFEDGDLIDRCNLLVFPVLLGAGKSLFARRDADKRNLQLADSATYSNGVAELVRNVVRRPHPRNVRSSAGTPRPSPAFALLTSAHRRDDAPPGCTPGAHPAHEHRARPPRRRR